MDVNGRWFNGSAVRIFQGPEGWLVQHNRLPAYFYELNEVEHATCENSPEQATSDGTLSG